MFLVTVSVFVSAKEGAKVAAADGIERAGLHYGTRARHAPHWHHRPFLRVRLKGGRGGVLFTQAPKTGLQIPVRKRPLMFLALHTRS